MNRVIITPLTADEIAHISHCLEQVVKFSQMLIDGDTSRPRDSMLQQLAFNLGRFTEIAHVDGRAEWRLLESLPIQEYIVHAKLLLANHNAMIARLAEEQLENSGSSSDSPRWYTNASITRSPYPGNPSHANPARNPALDSPSVFTTDEQFWVGAPIHRERTALDGWLEVQKIRDSEAGLMTVSLASINGWIQIEQERIAGAHPNLKQ